MNLAHIISVIKRRAIIIWCVIAVGLAIMYSLRNSVPASYAGVAHVVLVADSGARDPSVGIVDLPSIATSTVVLERVRN
jgi:uracil phosphoribosyltransferase